MTYKLFTDGGSRGNPGSAAIGGQILANEIQIATFAEYIGIATNNIAEYKALIFGIELAISKDINVLDCYLDSELVVKQLNGQYKVKDANMKELFAKVKMLSIKFDRLTFNHVPRSENAVADKLVNTALDKNL